MNHIKETPIFAVVSIQLIVMHLFNGGDACVRSQNIFLHLSIIAFTTQWTIWLKKTKRTKTNDSKKLRLVEFRKHCVKYYAYEESTINIRIWIYIYIYLCMFRTETYIGVGATALAPPPSPSFFGPYLLRHLLKNRQKDILL